MSPVAALLLFLACTPSCCQPSLNLDETRDSPVQDTQDTGDTGETADTAPPPPCAQPEVEPNDLDSQANPIVLEEMACGEFTGGGLDLDWSTFETTAAGWLKIDVDAASRGSEANVNLSLESDGGVQVAMSVAGDGGADPYLVIPVEGADTWYLTLNEQEAQSGDEDYDYQFRASTTKTPVDIDRQESHDNDSWKDADPIELDESVYGTVSGPTDLDWFVLETPEGRQEIQLELVAHRAGSPLNARIEIWYAQIKDSTQLEDEPQAKVSTSDASPSFDPIFTHTSYDQRLWYIKVRVADGGTGPAYWYTLKTTVKEAE
jgi:hypothetical protein